MINSNVTIVIPFLNEEKNLPGLFLNLEAQTIKPEAIVFVDAGSNDFGKSLIEDWAVKQKKSETEIRVINSPGAYPGKARNIGIKNARTDWVIFLDVGVTPQRDWLEESVKYVSEKKQMAGFGVCYFFSDGNYVSNVLCALSYGYGAIMPVLPGSIFHKSLFDEVGFFREDLRASEDILWIHDCVRFLGKKPVSEKSVVSYSSFPVSVSKAIVKWHLYAKASTRSRFNLKQQFSYFLFFLIFFTLPFFKMGSVALLLFVVYMIFRGVVMPYSRNDRAWLGRMPQVIFGCFFLGPILDLSKMAGFFAGYTGQVEATFKSFFLESGSRQQKSTLSRCSSKIQKK